MSPGRRALLCFALVGELVAGCARKAPGPEECHALALRWAASERGRISRPFGDLVIATSPDQVLERTNECLTTPYDRRLVECVTAGSPPRACYAAFVARKNPRGVPELP